MAALLLGGAWVSPAAAQEDGVFFDDPTSPGGQEYAVPLERARREGQASNREGSRQPSPRFGTGVAPSGQGGDSDSDSGVTGSGGAGGSGGNGNGSSGGGSAGREKGKDRQEGPGRDSEAGSGGAQSLGDVARTAARGGGSGGVSPELGLSGLALGVLLAGVLLGFVFRKLKRQPEA